ncbi:hypothetical protein MCHI_000061 [Candidatus Magnetoovum chiemensis]|nr:hypothetical protein MCHI_000061 [Candidatus Magnetoovum chiemensis]
MTDNFLVFVSSLRKIGGTGKPKRKDSINLLAFSIFHRKFR